MDYCATCQSCGRVIEYCRDNPAALGCHLLKEHAGEEMINFQVLTLGKNRSNKTQSNSTVKSCNSVRSSKSKSKPRSLIKTRVESWTPGSDPLYCPKCKCTSPPYIKKQRDKVAYNGLGAFFLLGCWPLCFLPMVMCGNSTILVCCSRCGYCFGRYDRKTGKLIPTPAERSEPPRDCIC